MRKRQPPATTHFHVLIGTIFVAMSAVFVTIPYALSAHPGEAPERVAAAEPGKPI
jgi:hypothetical protein